MPALCLFLVCVTLLSGGVILAQNAHGGAAGQSKPRRSEFNTREFLGLGRAPDPISAARGAQLYAANCAFCHGEKANGAEGPDLVRSRVVLHDEQGELVGPVVHQGRVNVGMPAFPAWNDQQLKDVAEFLHMRVEQSANRGLYTLRSVITGDAQAGEAYFRGAGKCIECHSATNDLAHIGSRYEPAELQQRFLYPVDKDESRTVTAPNVRITFASGQVVSGKLRRLDDFDVAIVGTDGAYQSYAIEKGVQVSVEDKLLRHRLLLDQYSDRDMHDLTAYLATLK